MIEIVYKNKKTRRYPPKQWKWVKRGDDLKSRNMEDVQVGDIVFISGEELEVESVQIVPLEL